MMADNDDELCEVVRQFRRMQTGGSSDDARRMLAEKVRAGYDSPQMRSLVADLIDPDKKPPRGRPRGSHLDPAWAEIGLDHERLLATGTASGTACEALAEEYSVGVRTIQKIIHNFRAAMEANAQTIADWDAEYESWSNEEKIAYNDEIKVQHEIILQEEDAFVEKTRAYEAEMRTAMNSCPHGCANGCKKAYILDGAKRRLCSFSVRNKTSI